ncbi:MAG: ATP-grasp domain-containing protein [Candidatus Moraniibacteriota bacterium]
MGIFNFFFAKIKKKDKKVSSGVISAHLEKDLGENEKFYFFSLLTNRFDLASEKMAELLSKKFGQTFEPIYIYSAEPNSSYQKRNYIIINEKLAKFRSETKQKKAITLQDYEDLNLEFRRAPLVKKLIKKLNKKQGPVFVYSFTSFGLSLDKKIKVIGPDSQLVEKYDNKIEQIKLFKELKLPIVSTRIFPSFEKILKAKLFFPVFISPAYTSGAAESAVIRDKKELDQFYKNLRKINKKSQFFAAKFLLDVRLSPNSTAMVCGENDTRVLQISDQILAGTKHMGNIYPTRASAKAKEVIIEATLKVGNHLSQLGFRGMFGCDFMLDSQDNCYIVDLNPRRQGGYLMVYLMSGKYDLLDLELRVALGEKVPQFCYEDFQKKIVWAHTKLIPEQKHNRLTSEKRLHDEKFPFERVGECFSSFFYPKRYNVDKITVGYYIVSGQDYLQVLQRTMDESKEILKCSIQ